jgi:UDP-N-acetylmuramate: L-alanyl-gamma-D-glutamyl-meso-diaminopimelate ligase
MPDLPKDVVKKGFNKNELSVFNERAELQQWLQQTNYENAVVVFMSSGNYDGLDTEAFAREIVQAVD